MSDPSRPATAAPERDVRLPWDLIPDENAPSRSIVVQFANRDAAHAALTEAGFAPTSGPLHALGHHDPRTAVKYAHPDGSTVVLAQQLADLRGAASVGG